MLIRLDRGVVEVEKRGLVGKVRPYVCMSYAHTHWLGVETTKT